MMNSSAAVVCDDEDDDEGPLYLLRPRTCAHSSLVLSSFPPLEEGAIRLSLWAAARARARVRGKQQANQPAALAAIDHHPIYAFISSGSELCLLQNNNNRILVVSLLLFAIKICRVCCLGSN